MKNNNKKNAFILMALVAMAFVFSVGFVSAECNEGFTTGDLRDCCDEYQEAACMGGERTCNSDADCVYCHSPISAQKDPGYPHTNTDGNYCLYSPDTSNACTCLDPNICMCADQIWGGEACRYLYNYDVGIGFLNRDCRPEHYDACEEVSGPLCRLNGGVCSFKCDDDYLDCNDDLDCEYRCDLSKKCEVNDSYTCVNEGGNWKWIKNYNGDYCEEPESEEPEEEEPEEEPEEPEEVSPRGKLERLYISRVFAGGIEKKITISQIRKRSSPKDDIRLDARFYNIATQMNEISIFSTWNVIDYSSLPGGGEQHLLLNMTGNSLIEETWQFFSSIRLK